MVKGSVNPFYADNIEAETVPGTFTGGTIGLTVDGLLTVAERFVYGLPEAEEITYGESKKASVTHYGDDMDIPYVGIGFVVRYMSDNVTTYVPMILTKARFQVSNTSAATQEDSIDWQTQELTADLMRDDSVTHSWKKIADGVSTEDEAEEILKVMLNITTE